MKVNEAAVSNDRNFNSFFSDGLVNYNTVPEFYEKPLRIVDDKLFYEKEKYIPLHVRTSFDDVLRGLIKDSFEIDYIDTYKGDNLLSMSPGAELAIVAGLNPTIILTFGDLLKHGTHQSIQSNRSTTKDPGAFSAQGF